MRIKKMIIILRSASLLHKILSTALYVQNAVAHMQRDTTTFPPLERTTLVAGLIKN